MRARCCVFLALVSVFFSLGATYRTTNFVVKAPTPQIAQRIGQLAEHYRREKAVLWLGYEMPAWRQPCPLDVTVDMKGPRGATSFNFGRDQSGRGMVLGRHMQIAGPLDRLLASVLPHEVTHTVFAHHFKCPVPRWADEGGCVLSEDDEERIRHDQIVRSILNSRREIPLRRLLQLRDYPAQVMNLYAQGYSLADYLINLSSRKVFLSFVADGMRSGWDRAIQAHYRRRSVEELEKAWLKHLRDTKGTPHMQVASISRPTSQRITSQGTVVRLTVPPAAMQPTARLRGQSPEGGRYGGGPQSRTANPPKAGRYPRYLPSPNQVWQAPSTGRPNPAYEPVPVELGRPQRMIRARASEPIPRREISPVGFPGR